MRRRLLRLKTRLALGTVAGPGDARQRPPSRSARPSSLFVRRFERLDERAVERLHVYDFVVGADIALY